MAYLQKQRNSQSGFLDGLVGFNNLTSPDPRHSPWPGLTVIAQTLNLKFEKPMPELLETIGFGLYSVVHPSDYDSKTGQWKNPKKAIASGPYRISEWTDENLILTLRKGYPEELRHKNAADQITVTWNPKDRSTADVAMGYSAESPGTNRQFHGSVPSGIAFVRCLSWSTPGSLCHSLNQRRILRDLFYAELEKFGATPIRSFLPLAIQGTKEAASNQVSKQDLEFLSKQNKSIRYRPSKHPIPFSILFDSTVINTASVVRFSNEPVELSQAEVYQNIEAGPPFDKVDLVYLSTGILIDVPTADIRFMFLSKEGILLPDADGSILKELKKEPLDFQQINQLLWDQAIIWPLAHFSAGLWAKNTLDFSLINTTLPPTELRWIGIKE